MWEETEFEREMLSCLIDAKGTVSGQNVFSQYVSARSYLVEHIYPFIVAQEPSLTDHSAKHVWNVLDNAGQLIGDAIKSLSAEEIYTLGMAILFHDVGNIKGRVEHFKASRIIQVYNKVRKDEPRYQQERFTISTIAEAHSGEAADGSKDTLKGLRDLPVTVEGGKVRPRTLAAILRFADELAEGPQRTSYYMQQRGFYAYPSLKYHEYAKSTNITIDRGNGRIALTYFVKLPVSVKKLNSAQINQVKDKLNFIYGRIEKLDQERKYARHYCSLLAPFSKTSFCINITTNNDNLVQLDECDLTDITIPGDSTKRIYEIHEGYNVDAVIERINAKLK